MRLKVLMAIGLGAMMAVGQIAERLHAQELTREQKVRQDKKRIEAEGFWLYNDLDQAIGQANKTGKPILVVLRCLPCEECVKLDDDLIDNDPAIQKLLEQYVCVRIVGTNGLDLKTFQYDTDQSFAVFMLNADKTVYGRFGTRSHRTEWVGDVSVEGMAKALQAGLELHKNYPANRESLAGKQGRDLEFGSPEQYPSLKGKYTDQLNYEGDVVKSCIHCHQIGDARREFYWNKGDAIPERVLFPYPHPKSIGLILDPKEKAMVKRVEPESIAANAGIQKGDELLTLVGQPLVSMADVQWALDGIDAQGGQIECQVKRGTRELDLKLELPAGWRRLDDIAWRVSSWGQRRIALGGMRLTELTAEERQAKVGDSKDMALLVANAGRYGPHATARKAGVRPDDVLISFDGKKDMHREADVFAYVNDNLSIGEQVEVTVLRGDRRLTFKYPIQK